MNLICPHCGSLNPHKMLDRQGKPCVECGESVWREAAPSQGKYKRHKETDTMAKAGSEPKLGKQQQEFMDNAKPIEAVIGGQKVYIEPKVFSTGSVGYGLSSKIQMPRGASDEVDKLQVGINMIVVGSKEWK